MTFDESSPAPEDTLAIGTDEGPLTFRLRRGEPSRPCLVYAELDNPFAEAPVPTIKTWPEAPVLVVETASGTDLEILATLSATQAPLTVVSDALATWSLTDEQTATVAHNAGVRIKVDGSTWWSGRVVCQS